MGELRGFFAIFLREWKVFFAEKSRIISSMFLPILWFIAFGFAIGGDVSVDPASYRDFIFPGIIGMAILFSSMFQGTYLITDKKEDLFKAIMVAPLSRLTIFLGKASSGVINAIVQVIILILVGLAFGVTIPLSSIIPILIVTFFMSLIFVSAGLIIGTFMDSVEGFGLIIAFVVYPFVFFSGAFNSLENQHYIIDWISTINPLTYGIDILRGFILNASSYSFGLNSFVILTLTVLFVTLGTLSFRKLR